MVSVWASQWYSKIACVQRMSWATHHVSSGFWGFGFRYQARGFFDALHSRNSGTPDEVSVFGTLLQRSERHTTSHTEVDKPELHFGLSHNTQRMATLGGEVRLRWSARTNTVHLACPKHKTVALITTHWDALGFRLAQLAHATLHSRNSDSPDEVSVFVCTTN